MSKKIKKILAICWGMQVAVTAAGGEVKKGTKGSHKGIAVDIEINERGLDHPLYKNKKKSFYCPKSKPATHRFVFRLGR